MKKLSSRLRLDSVRAVRLASIAAALLGLAACAHNATIHCDNIDGQWSCSGDVSSPVAM